MTRSVINSLLTLRRHPKKSPVSGHRSASKSVQWCFFCFLSPPTWKYVIHVYAGTKFPMTSISFHEHLWLYCSMLSMSCCLWKPKYMNALHLQWFFKEILILKMDTFLIEEANEDYLIRWCLVENYWENETLISWFWKKSFIWQNVHSIFTHFKVLLAKILTTFHFIGLSRILIENFESFSKLCNFI